MKRFFDEDVVSTITFWIWGTIYMKRPLVLCGCVLEVIDKIQEALGVNGAMGFVANVEFRQLDGPR